MGSVKKNLLLNEVILEARLLKTFFILNFDAVVVACTLNRRPAREPLTITFCRISKSVEIKCDGQL